MMHNGFLLQVGILANQKKSMFLLHYICSTWIRSDHFSISCYAEVLLLCCYENDRISSVWVLVCQKRQH